MKKRADIILYEKGLVESQEKAKRIIMEGIVFVGNTRIDKPGEELDENSEMIIKKSTNIYVSRGGLKLEKAINTFNLSLNNKISMDIGSSTGGFTDCMLKNGANKVFAVDVGYGQLDWKLRSDPKVVVMERTNIRHVMKEDIIDDIDFISIDVSFISLKLVLPVTKTLMSSNGEIIALIKPQFEAAKSDVGDKGIIRDKNIHFQVIKNIINYCIENKLGVCGLTYSPITGAKGNVEFLVYLKNNSINSIEDETILEIIEEAHGDLN
jgi:23S rRNA (cytidine1920-2'-O)/16S rRNA (cytidine1409-2'-O)-methyltransferase